MSANAGLGRRDGVVEEQLVEVAHAVEQKRVGVAGFDVQILRHHRRHGCVCGGQLGIPRCLACDSNRAGKGTKGRIHQWLFARGAVANNGESLEESINAMSNKTRVTDEEALSYHLEPSPGKLTISASTPMATQRDLSLAYSPGVAVPVEAIAANPETAYDYTTKGNMVAVITNGSAILGLGNLGALASKPVMEGKAVLFKRFADVDSIDLELDTQDADEFINAVRLMGPAFGGINLEDIKAPECFIIEQRLREEMDIPVFHDDQHGTAVICAAGLLNALHLTGKKIEDCKIVLNGAGAAGIA